RESHCVLLFFIPHTATSEINTLSLHDALPICGKNTGRPQAHRHPPRKCSRACSSSEASNRARLHRGTTMSTPGGEGERDWKLLRSEEHTSELQSRFDLVCRLLLEKKKNINLLS